MDELTRINNNITEAEQKLSQSLGAEIWGYSSIIDPSGFAQEIKFTSLSDEQKQLLQTYINSVNDLLKAFNLDEVTTQNDSSKSELEQYNNAFIEASSLMYNLRYAKAKSEAAEYQLLRIHTWLEVEMLKKGGLIEHPDTEISIAIPVTDVIKIKDNGEIDLRLSEEAEKVSHTIKTYLSLIPHARAITKTLFQQFLDNLSYGLIPRIYDIELTALSEKIIRIVAAEPINNIYKYLEKGYTIKQAVTNVTTYYKELLTSQNFRFVPQLKDYDELLDKTIAETLAKIPQLKEVTARELTEQIKNEVAKALAYGLVYPINFYQLHFRKANPNFESETDFDFVIDSYLYEGARIMNEYPVETYAIVLTDGAKEAIFERVTNGQVNPNYTLEKYLKYKPFKLPE